MSIFFRLCVLQDYLHRPSFSKRREKNCETPYYMIFSILSISVLVSRHFSESFSQGHAWNLQIIYRATLFVCIYLKEAIIRTDV
jgi:hypothetical protein